MRQGFDHELAQYTHFSRALSTPYHRGQMTFPVKICVVCGEEFELKPDKPGFANRCPDCTESEAEATPSKDPRKMSAEERKVAKEANEARRQAMRNLLYRKDI
jgi:hypothetical protein